MLFPAPPRPELTPENSGTTSHYLRYEDVAQDGRLMPIAIPPALGGLWREVVIKNPGARAAQSGGVVPILTRLTMTTTPQHIRVDRPTEVHSGFELAHSRDASGAVAKILMNVWCDLRGAAGRIVPREPAGALSLAGSLFAEHTFTRPFGPPDQRRVVKLAAEGYPEVPPAHYDAPAATTAMEAPAGATWEGELATDSVESAFTLDQTDSNQHVNSLVYIRIFLDAAQRRLASAGKPLRVRSTDIDICYRKPSFAGDRVRCHGRLFVAADGKLGMAGFVAAAGEDARPRCYVRVAFST